VNSRSRVESRESRAKSAHGKFLPSTLVPRLSTLLLAGLIACACFTRAAAAGISSGFDAANKLYEQGKFTEAAAAYESLLQSNGISATLYFNLGNAFFKSGRLGRAIAAYRQAEQLAPRDPDVRANLQFARNQATGPTLLPNRWQRWLGRLTLNEWTVLAAAALWLWLGLLAVLQWRPGPKPNLRGFTFAAGSAAVLLCVCVAFGYIRHSARTAIVVAHETEVRNGPLDESPGAFTVHDGAELTVLDRKGEWLEVGAGPRRIGWLRRDEVLVLPQA